MFSKLKKHALAFTAAALLLSACAAQPTYSPPEGPRASESCPTGEVWVCYDRSPSRLDRNEPPSHCRCEYPDRIH